ncbi:hypothetical protein [Rivihabitans pingtungensis]|uniref:hypothetical protein n=1 Tax=Rivihabitans pingtungensis TaxID=1054498 RepID=UPI00235692BF|nr:hypothetical protein [Rivihabitans pingtungensis]MCK6436206.1 hypothetical protein [Rivihabitans pingtungensis]
MDIVYLDQNKWIDLARVQAGTETSGPMAILYPELINAVRSKKVLFPLSVSHILETSKQNDPIKRCHLAETQAKLSRGFVYRSRAARLEVEISMALHRLFDIKQPDLPPNWAIAPSFLQAFEPMDALIAPASEVERLARINAHMDPAKQYVDYMRNQDDAARRAANVKIASDTAELVSRIEARRTRLVSESVDMRRRAYAVELLMENQNTFLQILDRLGLSFEQLKELGGRACSLIEDVPTLDVESRMAARLEAQTGSINTNDVFDIQAFYTAIPYSSLVVAEKASISRALQAKLHEQYDVRLSRSLSDLLHVYE